MEPHAEGDASPAAKSDTWRRGGNVVFSRGNRCKTSYTTSSIGEDFGREMWKLS